MSEEAGRPVSCGGVKRSPEVSVLLPVRNGAAHLDEALASLVSQTFEDFEVVAVDDGSTDATAEILERWATEDDRIRVLRQEPAGIVAALECARVEAVGDYLARMDADDVSLPGRFQAQLSLLESDPSLSGCGTRVEYFSAGPIKDGARRYQRWINGLIEPDEIERGIFVECPLPHPTFFLRTGAVEAVGGYRDRGWPEDYDLLFRLWEAGHRLGKVPEVLLRWRDREDRLSRTGTAYSPASFRRCKIHFLRRTLLADRNGVVIWGAGPTGKAFGRALRHTGTGIRAWVDLAPGKQGQEIHGAVVVEPDRAAEFHDALHLGAVAQPGAREQIRDRVRSMGLSEMESFVAIA